MESRGEHAPRPKTSVAERLRNKWAETVHPASHASEKAFRSIIAVLPPGDMKKSMELVVPQLRDILKYQDRTLAWGSLFQRGVSSVVFGIFGAVGGLAVEPITGITTGIGPAIGAATGIGFANVLPTPSQMERSRIALAGKQQEMMLRTSGGREAARVFDATRVDQITQAILWGTAGKGGAGGILTEASS